MALPVFLCLLLYIIRILYTCNSWIHFSIRTFLECKDVKAVVSLGCCYNLLSEERIEDGESQCGFPMSHAARSTSLSLGKSARDLACQVLDLIGPTLTVPFMLGGWLVNGQNLTSLLASSSLGSVN